ncbi:sensor histidine kinase [Nonomuraea soli]|uniref:Two-component system sensor histidine kinase DesK n=1 Tax=Nonomuraea soli TaxID=1032476 RepID=A0A7W0CKY5_9ACTN|nr:histidine kinase [Nonomuraea soli]MBA2893011.1 two-component system sensor histidine kinase DesK [Nonomuraea soli]
MTIWTLAGPPLVLWPLLVMPLAGEGARGVVAIVLVTLLVVTTIRLMLRAVDIVRGRGAWLEAVSGGLAATAAFPLIRQIGDRPAALFWSMAAGLLAMAIALRLPRGRRVPAILAAAVAILAAQWISGYPPATAALMGASALGTAAGVGMQWWTYEVAQRLEDARVVAAELAVAEERLRFAAELHDIQGHHLQVIALKSELAARVADRDKAVELMREVQELAREALTDTRAVVGGYRQVSLSVELANAVKVLRAAGVAATVTADDEVGGTAGRLLGLVAREATTNILRHSHASRASVVLAVQEGHGTLTVTNDGAEEASAAGSGLAALAERVEAAGGRLSWGNEQGSFTVRAVVPA